MKISYAILTHNEGLYIRNLLCLLVNNKRIEDEIVVVDDHSTDPLTLEILNDYKPSIRLYHREFDGDASSKNYLNSLCTGDYIVQIDSDELFHPQFIQILPQLLEQNPNVDLYRVPRINTVENLSLSKVREWGWGISKLENYQKEDTFNLHKNRELDEFELLRANNLIIKTVYLDDGICEVKYYIPIINFADYQDRIYRNHPDIKWEGLLHSKMVGCKTIAVLPSEEIYCLLHHKKLERQISQNNLYSKIEQNGKTKYKI